MNYENLYKILGRLFYHAAAADGNVRALEKEKLHQTVLKSWQSLEQSTDEFGTDQANQIAFSFDFEEAEAVVSNGFTDFEVFYKGNKSEFTPLIKNNILQTIKAINEAYYGENKKEREIFRKIEELFYKE